MSTNLTLLANFFSPHAAHMARGLLENQGIPCFLFDEHHNGIAHHAQFAIGGIRLMVPKNHYDEAYEILAEKELIDLENAEAEPILPKTKKGILKFFLSLILTLLSGVPTPFKDKEEL